MKKREMRELAKDIIQNSLSTAYYNVVDNNIGYYMDEDMDSTLSEEEKDELVDEINKICRSLCKHMGREHYTL